jgi:hypothetical protein
MKKITGKVRIIYRWYYFGKTLANINPVFRGGLGKRIKLLKIRKKKKVQ